MGHPNGVRSLNDKKKKIPENPQNENVEAGRAAAPNSNNLLRKVRNPVAESPILVSLS